MTAANGIQLVPIPTTLEYLQKTHPIWFPFLEGISRRSREPIDSLLQLIRRGEVQIILAWNSDTNTADGVAGVRLCRRGNDLIGEIVWTTGKRREEWQHLITDLEKYLKSLGCNISRPINRPGWAPMLKEHGYRITHYVMEKAL